MASAAEQLAANMNFASFQKATELHKRIWFTIIALVVYRLGSYVPIPGIDVNAFARLFNDKAALKKARALIEECGYGRRLPELKDAERRLGLAQ